ncbi:MAG: hypothetical protein IJX99_05980 [Clostridia bacterium]|nr:hypothetical protein [Clostridia bacterium]
MNSKGKKILVVLVLIIIIVVCLLGIILLKKIESNESINDIIAQIVEETNWPIEDVPIFYHNDVIVEKPSEGNWSISFDSGIDYQELREYLLELEDEDFSPDKSTGSQSPRLLYTSLGENSAKDIYWQGNKESYTIRVHWALEGATDEFNVPYSYNFDLNLTKKIEDSKMEIPSDDTKQTDENDFVELSGDISGDISGDVSGDVLDNTSEGKGEESDV